MDIISYILSRKYTDNSIVGLGAIKGANCTVKDIVHQDGINTVTFEWVGTDGTTKTRDMVVYDGTPIYVWESGNTYHYGDLAIYESQFYRCIVENNDVVFDNTKWNEIGSPDGNYDIVQSKALLPARFTAADRKLYFVIDECTFYLWDGTQWVGQTYLVQEETIPTASAKYLGRIYQYIGATDTSFVHGCCYECVSDGANIPTYSWVSVGNSPIFTGTQAQWDSLTPAQQNVYEFVNIIGDEQNINLGIYLRKVNSMPNAEDCPSEIVMYVGTTTSTYTQGYIYRSTPTTVNNVTTYSWVRQDVQPSHPYIQSDWAQNNSNANDYIKNKPTLGTASAKNYTSNVRPNNTDLVESHAVYSAINSALSSIYVPRGELSCAELTADLLIPANVGNVYTMSDSGTTSALFINGAGHSIAVNDNVGIIRAGGDTILFNLMGNAFDLHDYQTKELETPLTIDGTQETEVEDALSGLNEGLNNRVTYEYQGKVGAKNLIPYPYTQSMPYVTPSLVTFALNDDTSVNVDTDGQLTTGYSVCYLLRETSVFKHGTYTLSVNNEDLSNKFYVQAGYYDDDNNQFTNKAICTNDNSSVTFEVTNEWDNHRHCVRIVVEPNITVDNVSLYLMVRYASDTNDVWQPYAKTNYELTQDVNSLSYIKDVPIAKGSGTNSIVENNISINYATAPYSHSEGYYTRATASNAHAEGSSTQAIGDTSHAEGRITVASNTASHSEGHQTNASGEAGHAEGGNTTASGQYGHAEGSWSQAVGNNSHAEGQGSYSYGLTSHAQNDHTVARGAYQTTIGSYNIEQGTSTSKVDTDYALIIGNGTDSSHRSNALAVQWDGTVVFQDNSTIKSAKTAYEVMGKVGAKNLLAYPYTDGASKIRNGVTFTVDSDGVIHTNGTSDGYTYYDIQGQLKLPQGKYTFNDGRTNAPDTICFVMNFKESDGTIVKTLVSCRGMSNDVLTFEITAEDVRNMQENDYYILTRYFSNINDVVDWSGLTFYPMLRLADDQDDTWQPYAMTNKQLTDSKLDKISALPTASVSYLNQTYLLTSTQTGYQKGGIYQCVSDGEPTPTYSWQLISSADMVEFTAQELLAMW